MVQTALMFSAADMLGLERNFSALTEVVPLGRITTADEYDRAVRVLDALIDHGAGDEGHPLAGLLGLVGEAIADFGDAHHVMPPGTPIGALRFLMDQHGLQQRDLTEIGSQGVVSEVLSGKRQLSVKQITKLAKRFGVAPGVFIEA